PIVVTELEGGLGNASYQWQYKNERTPDFISIEGATEKSYTPSAIDVATTYRRVATDGVYKSISNELTLSIRPLPSVAQIESGLSEETMKEMGLVYKQHEEYQWIPNVEVMEMYLVDSAYNADHTYWQKSYNQMDWQTESTDNDSMLVADTTSLVYYRYIAESSCGADTSSFVKLSTANIEPITDDQIDWTNTDTFVCLNDSKINCLRFGLVSGNSNNAQVAINNKYLYSYKVESNSNISVWCGSSTITEKSLVDYSNSVRVYEMDSTGNRRLPSDIVTLYVTRHDTARGLSVTRPVTLKVDAIDVTFAMSIENKPAIKVGENGVNQISQGDRVQFIPVVSSNIEGEMSYKWVLEEPLNLELSKKYGGRNGLDGLTSEIKSPSCYYYNGGYYPISLTVSDGFCQQTVRDTSLYISESSLRSFNVSMALADDWSEYGKEGFDLTFVDHHFINIFPTLVTDFVTVSSTDKSDHNAMLIDELGRTLLVVSFNGSVQISMNEYISGTYFIVVDNKENFKIIKKQIGF
ncbi:MAG: T9SS type A sorting domain-containing protein, partial [Paludibacteraceae bacterium]|nr:T9SS type A sorting domain-containing protein [Paludibacteraceae bacterium]